MLMEWAEGFGVSGRSGQSVLILYPGDALQSPAGQEIPVDIRDQSVFFI